ncbi:DNA ligase [Mycobacterium sp. 1100029.7]|nr:DNA ligase [Mycobacterium sp. 1100029.7]
MPLIEYRRNRRAGVQPERRGRLGRRRRATPPAPCFVIQYYGARSEHYDLRLEINGELASWFIPHGPSTNPKDRRMARRIQAHPLDYPGVAGVLPDGEDGAGPAIIWDRGSYTNATQHDMAACLDRGHLSFRLQGAKLQGGFTLTRIRDGQDETWLLIKRKDGEVDPRRKPVASQPAPVLSGRTSDDLTSST